MQLKIVKIEKYFCGKKNEILARFFDDFAVFQKKLHTLEKCAAKNLDKKQRFFAQIRQFVQKF